MGNEFGIALREHRRVAGVSQRELAEKVHLDFSYISKIENGRLPPPAADTIVLICKVLEIPAEELLALTGKIPSAIHQSVSTSPVAQGFLREVQEMALTDDEWKKMVRSLRSLKGKRR